MAEPMRSDEEQIEAIKRWWETNGNTTMGVVAALVIAYASWSWWTSSQASQAQAASALYQTALDGLTAGQPADEESRATTAFIVAELKQDHAGSTYAYYGSSLVAAQAFEAGDLEQAAEELEWLLEQNPEEPLVSASRIKLAQVRMDQNELGKAKTAVSQGVVAEFAGMAAEIEGDIYYLEGDVKAAKSAYKRAIAASDMAASRLITLKMNSVVVTSSEAKSEAGAPVATQEES